MCKNLCYWLVEFLTWLINLCCLLSVLGTHTAQNELHVLFIINHYTKRWCLQPLSSDLRKLAVTSNAGWHWNIIKGMSWRWKTDSVGPCQRSTPRFKSDTCCCCSPPKKAAATKKFVTTLSKSLWAFLISSDLYFYPTFNHFCQSYYGLTHQTASPHCHLFSTQSIYVLLRPKCQYLRI